MPELPEVETVCRGLNQITLNQEIQGSEVLLERSLAYPSSLIEFERAIQGAKIALWKRRGKYLLAQLTHPESKLAGTLGVHLRMTGQLLWLNQEESLSKHTRIRLFFEGKKELRFVDIRTFGKVWWVPPNKELTEIITGLKKLGPEPFASDFSPVYLQQRLSRKKRVIKTALLEQELVAGIGNIYADEVLFKSKIRPDAIACDLNSQQIASLHQAIVEVLSLAIEQGGTTFSDFLNLLGVNGNYGNVAWVYGRTGEPCRVCGSTIERVKLGGRSSHFCPNCQS